MAAAFLNAMPGGQPLMGDRGALARVFDLPILTRQELCRHLDADGGWKELASAAGLTSVEVGVIERRCVGSFSSPADQLLTMWSQRSVLRVMELYVALHEKRRVFEAQLIEHLVPAEYRVQITPPQYSMELITSVDVRKENVGKQQQAVPSFEPPSPREASEPGTSSGTAASVAAVSPAVANLTLQTAPTEITHRLAVPKFPYEELSTATRNFSDECLIGSGRFSRVYKCTMRNTTYAVKVKAAKSDNRNLDAELDFMQSYPHENILPIYGYCVTADSVFLCCQFMANKSLADTLSSTAVPLLCEQRCHIAVGTAKGLQYLHGLRDQPVIHGNVKSSNILLDKHLEAKLSDFALARRATSNSVASASSSGGGSAGLLTHYTRQEGDPFGADVAYAAPELMEAVGCVQPSTKSDVYSFGIVLLEVCTGLKASASSGSRGNSPDWLRSYVAGVCPAEVGARAADSKLRLADPRITWDPAFYLELLELAQSCSHNLKKRRPDMAQVFANLQRFDVDLQIRQRAATAVASGGLLGPSTYDLQAGQSGSLGYEQHGSSFVSMGSTNVATLPAVLISTDGLSPTGDSSSLTGSSHAGRDRSTLSSFSSWSMGDGSGGSSNGSSIYSPGLQSPGVPSNHNPAGQSRMVHQPSEASETPDDDEDGSEMPTTSTSTSDPLSSYLNEYGDASGTGESDANLLLQDFDAMSLRSNGPTESSLDDL